MNPKDPQDDPKRGKSDPALVAQSGLDGSDITEVPNQLLAILGRLSDGVVALDRDWKYTYVNPTAAKLLQRDKPSDLIGRHIWTEYPEGVGQPFYHAYLEAAETQKRIIFEEYYEPWDRWFENRIYPSVDGLTIYFSDISDRVKSAKALRRASAVFTRTKDCVVLVGLDGNITLTNPAFSATTGYDGADLIGQPITRMIDDVAGNPKWAELEKVCCWTGHVTGRRQSGALFPVHLAKEALFNDAGVLEGHILIATDLSEQRNREKAEKQLAHTQKMESIGALTGGVAHDFNNLLAVILGNLELLREEISGPNLNRAMADEMIEAAIDATVRGADLTSNMLSFARRAMLEPKDLDLNGLVAKARNWIGRTLPETIVLETSMLAGLWTIVADEGATQSALLNLIINARDAMPHGGRLTLETTNVRIDEDYVLRHEDVMKAGRYVMLAVSDTGTGIPPENLDRIFEPFFTTKAFGLGSGLGLSMIQGFMRQSGGNVQVYSEVGVGTTFKLYFKTKPGLVATQMDGDTAAFQSKVSAGCRVLMVEDDEPVLNVLSVMLRRAGYIVTTAISGDAAKTIFEADTGFDVLLTDIVMPGRLQGTTLARELRDIVPDLPIVFMSGYANEAAVHGNGLRPEDIRLMKPVRNVDLIAAIERAMAIYKGNHTTK